MIVNTPAIDWITLTSWHESARAHYERIFHSGEGRVRVSGAGQYKGFRRDSMFAGMAEIKGRQNYMLVISGQAAHQYKDIVADGVYGDCTRIDLQVTVPLPHNHRARRLVDRLLESGEWKGKKRPVTLIEGGQGMDTVYIGKRSGGDFTRLYVKADGDLRWLRFETQFQRPKSPKVWSAIVKRESMIGRFLRGRVDILPDDVKSPGIVEVRRALENYLAANVTGSYARVSDERATLNWLRDTVTPVVTRMLNDHDLGEETRELVRQWTDKAWSKP